MASTTFEVELDGPIDLVESLQIFQRSGDDMIDRFDGEWAVRTTRVDGRTIPYACRVAGDTKHPLLFVTIADDRDRGVIERVVRHMFLPLGPEFTNLCIEEPMIGRLARLHLGFRPVMQSDLLGALVRCISAQQVNLKWASTVRGRLAENFGVRHRVGVHFVYSLEAERLAALNVAAVRALQLTNRKSEYIINVARAIAEGELSFEILNELDDDEVIARITAVRGLGVWSAEWILARTLGRPRISAFDLGVRKAVGKLYFGGKMPTPEEVRDATAHWGKATAMAQGLVLHAQHERTLEATVDAKATADAIVLTAIEGARSPRQQKRAPRQRFTRSP
jgi:DNA-3-methyladenine glycosylase II